MTLSNMNHKFFLYLATGSKQYCEFLFTMNVKNILISFFYKEPWDLKPLIKRNNCNIICDSGAFSSWNLAQREKRNGNSNWKKYLIDIDEYAEFIEKHKDIIFRAVNLDVIPGEQGQIPSQEQVIEAAEQGWKNYLYLKKKGYDTIHVFHQGESFDYLDRMLKNCNYIGISPCNDYSDNKKFAWLDHIFRYIMKSNNPKIKTHGFGVTSKKLVERYPWWSCDSSSYSLTAAMGSVITPWGRVYVSDQNLGDKDHILNRPQEIQDHINKYFMEHVGYNIQSMTRKSKEYTGTCECGREYLSHSKVQAYKPRNFANIVYFLRLEEKIRSQGATMNFLKQQTIF